jgi:hypothetical protein
MQAIFVSALEAQRVRIRARWEDLLRAERFTSPLANPDTLVHLMDLTLDEVFATLAAGEGRRRHSRSGEIVCRCGRNPLLVYFSVGRQAIREALVWAQIEMAALTGAERDGAMMDLDAGYSQIARREIESFCAVCQFRDTADARSAAAAVL